MIINICDTTILCRDQLSHKEFRVVIVNWLKENYLNNSFTNTETGFSITINKTCIEKLVSSFGDIKAHAYTAIPSLIENATFNRSEDDNRNRPDFIKMLVFKSLAEINGTTYEAWLYVRQTRSHYFLYSVNMSTEIIKA